MKNLKFVTILSDENGNSRIIDEFDNLIDAFESYNRLNVNDLEDKEEYELIKYNEDNTAIEWEDYELISINQPLRVWVIKSK